MFDIGATPRHGIQIHQEIQSAPCLQHVRCCHQHCAGVPAMKETILKRLAVKGDQEGQPWRFSALCERESTPICKGTANKHQQTGFYSNPREKGYQFTRVSSSKVRDKRSWIAWIYTGSLKCLVYLSVKTAAKQETVTFRTTFNVPKSFWLEPVSSARSKPHCWQAGQSNGHQWHNQFPFCWKIFCCILSEKMTVESWWKL